MGLLAFAVVAAMFVVTRFVFRAGIGLPVAAGVGAALLLVWFVVPLVRRRQ